MAPATRHVPPWRLSPAAPVMPLPVAIVSAAAWHSSSKGRLLQHALEACWVCFCQTSVHCLPMAYCKVLTAFLTSLQAPLPTSLPVQ